MKVVLKNAQCTNLGCLSPATHKIKQSDGRYRGLCKFHYDKVMESRNARKAKVG